MRKAAETIHMNSIPKNNLQRLLALVFTVSILLFLAYISIVILAVAVPALLIWYGYVRIKHWLHRNNKKEASDTSQTRQHTRETTIIEGNYTVVDDQ